MSGVLKKNQNILLKRWPELIKAFNDKNPEISTFADVFIMSLEVDSIYTRIFDISCELYYKKYNLPFCYYNINKRWYRSKEAIERLNKNKQDLKNSDIQVRYKALCNLALIKNEKAIKCIFNALNDTSPKIRSLAIYLLKKNNYFKHSNYLKNFLDDESSDVRIAAFEYFKEIYKPDNIDFYIGILKNKDQYLRLLNFIFLMEKNNNWYKEKDLKPYYYFIAELLFSEKQKYHLYKEDYDEIIKVLNYIDPDITSTLLQLKEARDSQEFENRIIFK